MKKTIRLIVTSIGLLSIFACTKDLYELENENSFSKEKVEKWFETSFKESEQWKQNKAAQSSTPDWNQGTYVKKGKLEVYEFPLIEDKTTVTVPVIGKMTPENTSKVRSVLFSTLFRIAFVKTETGQIVVRKLYYVPDYDYLLSKEYDINEAVINKEGDDFTGTLITNNWNNKVLSYHRIANGKAVGQIKKINGTPPKTDPNLQLNMKTYKRNSRMSARDMEGGWLNEVPVINDYHAPDYSGPKGDTYWGDSTFGGGTSDNYDWGLGGGGGTGYNSPQNPPQNPPQKDPCDELKKQNNNTLYNERAEALKKNTGLRYETGFAQKKDGTFLTLQNGSSDHSLSIPKGLEYIGFNHTHIDPYENGEYNSDGDPKVVSPIKMFSPNDIARFLELIRGARESQISLDLLYLTMTTSSGVYTLKYAGTWTYQNLYVSNEVNTRYKEIMEKNVPEKGLFKFLDEMGIKDVELYKQKKDKTHEKKSVDPNGKTTSTPCP